MRRPSNATSARYRKVGINTVRKFLRSQNIAAPETLEPFGHDGIEMPRGLVSVLRNKRFLVQVYQSDAPGVVCRLTVNRTAIDEEGEYCEGITWDELMELKRQAGYAGNFATEVYPADSDLVDAAAMRHLWILECAPEYAWRREASKEQCS